MHQEIKAKVLGVLIASNLFLSSANAGRTPLYVGGLFELTEHWWSSYTNLFPVVLEQAFEAVRNHSTILQDYDIKLVQRDTKGQNGNAAKQMIELLEEHPPKLAIFGPGLSDELTVTGQVAPFYNVIELSYVATTASTVDQELFPTLFSVNQVTTALNPLRIEMMRYFDWSRVGTIANQDDMSTSQMNAFHEMLQDNNMTLVTSAVISDTGNIKDIIAMFKQFDVRIIMGAFRSSIAPEIFCEAYRQGIYGRTHVWVLSGPSMYDNWIKNADLDGLNCTREQLVEASAGHFTLDYHKISKSHSPTVAGKSSSEIMEELSALADATPYKLSSYSGWIYDSAWALAIGLDNSIKYLEKSNLTLDNYTYSKIYLDAITAGMSEVSFRGVSGPVSFDELGFRVGITYIQQNFNDTKKDVASFDILTDNLTWYVPVEQLWQGGSAPQDRFTYRLSFVPITHVSFGLIMTLALVGCLLTLSFFSFNIYYRNNRVIKMSSPMINNIIIVGCLILYLEVLLTAYDFKFADIERGEKMCMVRVWLMAIGFTSLFGAMFSKTYRVYLVFRDNNLKSKVIKDYHLFGIVAIMLLFDIILLFPWSVAFPLTTGKFIILSEDISDQNVIVSNVYMYCYGNKEGFWYAAMYVYKGLLLAFGAFLAWETRKVKVPALNDSTYIGICIYNVVVMCVFGVPLAHLLPLDQTDLAFVLSSGLILFCTTLCLCIIFVPKIQARNQIHGRFIMTTDGSNDTSTLASTAFTKQSEVTMAITAPPPSVISNGQWDKPMGDLKAENDSLRMQIAKESIALAKLKKTLLEMTGNIHLYKSGDEYIVFRANTTDNHSDICDTLEDVA